MQAEVSDKYLVRIKHDLTNKGLTYDELREDLLDHICCMVEEDMESGGDFESSYGKIMSDINDSVFPDLQHKTILLLDKKFQKMKKITYALGLTGAILSITGAIFKTQHWPGASIIMMLGFMIVILGFLPLYFIGSYKEQTEKPKIIYPVIGYLSLFFVFTGAVFKIMHWPGAAIMLRTSIIVLLVGFLPLYIVQIFQRSVKSKVNPAYIIMLLVGISIVLILSRVNLSKDAIDRYTDMTLKFDRTAALVEENSAEMLKANGGDSALTDEIQKIITWTDALEMQVDQMHEGLLQSINQSGIPIDEAKGRDRRNTARDAYLDNGLAVNFLKDCRDYKEYVVSVLDEPVLDNQVEIALMFSDGHWLSGWDPKDYAEEPMIVNYFKISQIDYMIAVVENKALEALLNE